MKKIILWIFFTLLTLVLLIGGVIAVVINFVFTPEKLTPMVERVVNENIDARLSVRSIELTFFSTFPRFGLEVHQGTLTTLKTDSLFKNDTIVSFEKLTAIVDPIALLKDDAVVVHRIDLSSPKIYATVDYQGKANWDVFSTLSSQDSTASDTTQKANLSFSLSDIEIANGKIVFDNRQNDLYARADSIEMKLRGDLTAAVADMDMQLSLNNLLLWQDGQLRVKNIDFSSVTSMAVDTISKRVDVRRADVGLNGMSFEIVGAISADTVDMQLSFAAPSVERLLGLLPLDAKTAKLSASGGVQLKGTIKGGYKNGAIPVIKADLDVDNVTAKYSGFKYGIDKLDIKASAYIDLNGKSSSYVQVGKFVLNGASTRIDVSGRVDNLLYNPLIRFTSTSAVNLTELASTLPFKSDISLGGVFELRGSSEFSLKQLRERDYGSITAQMSFTADDAYFRAGEMFKSELKSFTFTANNVANGLIEAQCNAVTAMLSTARSSFALDSLRVIAQGVKAKADSLTELKCVIAYSGINVSLLSDSITLMSLGSKAELQLNREQVLANLSTDSIELKMLDNSFVMRRARFKGDISKAHLNGSLMYAGLKVESPLFPLPMSMPVTSVTIKGEDVTLRKASFHVGNTDVVVSGMVSNLRKASLREKPLVVKMDINSGNLDLTQIIHTLNATSKTTNDAESVKTESAEPENQITLFPIPKGINFELNTNLNHISFGSLNLDDFVGQVTLIQGVARLNNLSFTTLGARLESNIVYDPQYSDSMARVGVELRSRSIDVHSVIELIPTIDSLIPMMTSFEGKVDFNLVAQSKLSQNLTINPNDIQAVASFSGDDLVLLDGQTFTEISKLLMFKNKQRNVVDSVSVQFSIHDGTVEIFPFLIQMDRYRAAVGGEHFFDNKFDYHISVLKSPIPFKFGVNISGSLDKMKVGIGKTKYKFLNEPTYVRQLNPKYIELGKQIRKNIKDI